LSYRLVYTVFTPNNLANNEVTFMVLEGGMVALAVILLIALHLGLIFGREGWRDASWNFSGKAKSQSGAHEKIQHQNLATEVWL